METVANYAQSESDHQNGSTRDGENVTSSKKDRRKRIITRSAKAVTVCISSRALFDLEEAFKIFEEEGITKYNEEMIKREERAFGYGTAYPFVKALLAVNERLRELNSDEKCLFDVVLMSNNSAQVGVAMINTINHYGLEIERICLTAGKSVIGYLEAFGTDLFLSADRKDVAKALNKGIAAAAVYTKGKVKDDSEKSPVRTGVREADTKQLRVAFDGDAVLFEIKPEESVGKLGFSKHLDSEYMNASKPLEKGPLQKFAAILGEMKKKFTKIDLDCPIRTYMVTKRRGATSGKRALITLRQWGLDIDEAFFLAGASKGPILEKIRPHLFFDDQKGNIENSREYGVPAAQVLNSGDSSGSGNE